MGQKVPPRANRLGVIDDPDSTTYASCRAGEFASILQEDTIIRNYLKKKLKDASISKVLIQRKPGQIQVGIVTARPGLIFGKANEEQLRVWNIEKETQQAAFDAAQLGNTCADVDNAARAVLEKHSLGPDYKLPGLPHRTGHGIGLGIHEWPYIVRNDATVLVEGMTFSNEPMICVPDKFGIRLEDHIYMTKNGPKWFTKPMFSIENPFGYSE